MERFFRYVFRDIVSCVFFCIFLVERLGGVYVIEMAQHIIIISYSCKLSRSRTFRISYVTGHYIRVTLGLKMIQNRSMFAERFAIAPKSSQTPSASEQKDNLKSYAIVKLTTLGCMRISKVKKPGFQDMTCFISC